MISIYIYDNICRIAKKKNMSIRQVELKAGLCGVIGRWKNEFTPTYRNLEKVAKALDVSISTLTKEPKEEAVDERKTGDP